MWWVFQPWNLMYAPVFSQNKCIHEPHYGLHNWFINAFVFCKAALQNYNVWLWGIGQFCAWWLYDFRDGGPSNIAKGCGCTKAVSILATCTCICFLFLFNISLGLDAITVCICCSYMVSSWIILGSVLFTLHSKSQVCSQTKGYRRQLWGESILQLMYTRKKNVLYSKDGM